VTDSKGQHNSLVLRKMPSTTSNEVKKIVSREIPKITTEGEFTEVFSWGNDKNGQLGLGQRLSQGKQMHPVPRFCSYNIPINAVACGQAHSVFITSKLIFCNNHLQQHLWCIPWDRTLQASLVSMTHIHSRSTHLF
jgi:hypothetical protein